MPLTVSVCLCFTGFWDSVLCSQRRISCRPLSRTLSPQRINRNRGVEGQQQEHIRSHCDSAPPTLRSHAPPPSFHLERRHSSGPLCFVNPLFLQTHQHHYHCEDDPPSCAVKSNQENAGKSELLASNQTSEQHAHQNKLNSKLRTPPPRPPPPCSMPRRRPAPPPPGAPPATSKPKSMSEVVPMATRQHQSSTRRPAPARPTMGGKHSSPSKSASSPIPVPSNPPPPRPKKPDLEAHRCHIALDDETIAKALSRAKLPPCHAPPAADVLLENNIDSSSSPNERGRQRLSDMSMSTSSSDSLEYSQSPGFSLGLAPSPSKHLNHQGPVEDSSEEDEDGEEEEEEEDYGVGLETDLEMRLRPSFKTRRQKVAVSLSGGSFILPRALRGHFRKVSGMLSSFMTPERRAIKKIAELSRDKSSYFGSLVHDYITFVQENRSCHTSGMDFLQTLRQFMTQMKAYLRQTSELDPPIESLIPEEQIGKSLKSCS